MEGSGGGGGGGRGQGGEAAKKGLTCCYHSEHCSLGLIECPACIDADAIGELELQDALRWIITVVLTCHHFCQGGRRAGAIKRHVARLLLGQHAVQIAFRDQQLRYVHVLLGLHLCEQFTAWPWMQEGGGEGKGTGKGLRTFRIVIVRGPGRGDSRGPGRRKGRGQEGRGGV